MLVQIQNGFMMRRLLTLLSMFLSLSDAQVNQGRSLKLTGIVPTISFASSMLENRQPSALTNLTLALTRTTSGAVWQTGQCYQIYVPSPYSPSNPYQTFNSTNPPSCSTATNGFVIGQCTVVSSSTVSFSFVKVDSSKNTTTLEIKISNFNNPYSARSLVSLNLRLFSDQACALSPTTVTISGSLDIKFATLPSSSVVLDTNSPVMSPIKEIGYQGKDNELVVAFKPTTTMDPTGNGQIKIVMPSWWQNGVQALDFMDLAGASVCSSNCMQIASQTWDSTSNSLLVVYTQMKPSCFQNQIRLRCPGFKNPIYKQVWSGFQVITFDGESRSAQIEVSELLSLDATKYQSFVMDEADFFVSPTDQVINQSSVWNFAIKMDFPVVSGCIVQISLPSDLQISLNSVQGYGFLAPLNGNVLASSDYQLNVNGLTKTLLVESCKNPDMLSTAPAGQLLISSITTPPMVIDTGSFFIEIYKGSVISPENLIAHTVYGVIVPAGALQPGPMTNMVFTPQNPADQVLTRHRVQFTTANQFGLSGILRIQMPQKLTLPSVGSTIQLIPNDTVMTATTGLILSGNVIEIHNLFNAEPMAPYDFDFWIASSINPFTAVDAGFWAVSTYLIKDGIEHKVDFGNSTSFVASPGTLFSNSPLTSSSYLTSASEVTYSINFTLNGTVSAGGAFQVHFPPSIQVDPVQAVKVQQCVATYTCTATNQTIIFRTSSQIAFGSPIFLSLSGLTNPRSTQQIPLLLISIDSDGNLIDKQSSFRVKMNTTNSLSSFSITSSSQVNGGIANYTIAFASSYQLQSNDVLSFDFPSDIGAPVLSNPMCLPISSNLVSVACTVSGSKLHTTFTLLIPNSGTFSFFVSGVRNPISTKPSGSCTNILISDRDQYPVLSFANSTTPIQTSSRPFITNATLLQQSKTSLQWNLYTIQFQSINPIPRTGAIQLSWPSQIQISKNRTDCIIQTNRNFNSSCSIDEVARMIVITGAFIDQESFPGAVTILLDGVRNPETNAPGGSGFVIKTYADSELKYNMDEMQSNVLVPSLSCTYPCRTCSSNDPTVCTSCWVNTTQPVQQQFYTVLGDQGGVCEQSCRNGSSSNGSVNKVCAPCDPSCVGCIDNGQFGDAARCLTCAANFPLRVNGTLQCLSQCTEGLFQSNDNTCSQCDSPCSACTGTSSFCTKCGRDSNLPALFQPIGQQPVCVADPCPAGYTNVGGICQPCASPCSKCSGNPSFCTQCDGTGNTTVTLEGICYKSCPSGTTQLANTTSCKSCLAGCNRCDSSESTVCLECASPLKVLNGTCYPGCPKGYIETKKKNACVVRTIDDLKKVPFPFLFALLIVVLVALHGKFKVKLSAFGVTTRNDQRTVTSIICALSPLQWLATAFQAIFAVLFGVKSHFILAVAVFVIFSAFNIAFQTYFNKHFGKRDLLPEKKAQVKKWSASKRRENKAELERLKVPVDAKFGVYKSAHSQAYKVISVLTCITSFKVNKILYSHFYSFGMFKATWSKEPQYRKAQMWFTIVHMFLVSCPLIVIGIAGMSSMTFYRNQLWITFFETFMLSLLDIVLSAYELFKLKDYLAGAKPLGRAKVSSVLVEEEPSRRMMLHSNYFDIDDDVSRMKMMSGLLYRVFEQRGHFLNNKLDDLLDEFGSRRAKSMIDIEAEREEDPRRTMSYPLTPTLREKYNQEHHFTKADAFEKEDNCYAAVRAPGDSVNSARDLESQRALIEREVQLRVQQIKVASKNNDFIEREEKQTQTGFEEEDRMVAKITNPAKSGVKNSPKAVSKDAQSPGTSPKQVKAQTKSPSNTASPTPGKPEPKNPFKKVEQASTSTSQSPVQSPAKQQSKTDAKVPNKQTVSPAAKSPAKQEPKPVKPEMVKDKQPKKTNSVHPAQPIETVQEHAKDSERKAADANSVQVREKVDSVMAKKGKAEATKDTKNQSQQSPSPSRIKPTAAKKETQKATAKSEPKTTAKQSGQSKQPSKIMPQRVDEEVGPNDTEGASQKEFEEIVDKTVEEEKKVEEIPKQKQAQTTVSKTEISKNKLAKPTIKNDTKATTKKTGLQQQPTKVIANVKGESVSEANEPVDVETNKVTANEEKLLSAGEEETQKKAAKPAVVRSKEQALQAKSVEKTSPRVVQKPERVKQPDKVAEQSKVATVKEKSPEHKQTVVQPKQTVIQPKPTPVQKEQTSTKLQKVDSKSPEHKPQALKLTTEAVKSQEGPLKTDKSQSVKQTGNVSDKKQLVSSKGQLSNRLQEGSNSRNVEQAQETQRTQENKWSEGEETARNSASEIRLKSDDAQRELFETANFISEPQMVEREGQQTMQLSQPVSNQMKTERVQPSVAQGSKPDQPERRQPEAKSRTELDSRRSPVIKEFERPDADKRNFNVNDVLGDWSRDERGNLIIVRDSSGKFTDRQNRLTNAKGYLINQRGDIVEGITGKYIVAFKAEDLDQSGELPAPFSLEKYNFAPLEMQGDLGHDFDPITKEPKIQLLWNKEGLFVDRQHRRINSHGWLIDDAGNIVDSQGRVRFDRHHCEDGNLKQLYRFNGTRFNLKDVMGVFETHHGLLQPHTSRDGSQMTDLLGRKVNKQGYLVDSEGNIIDRAGRKVWKSKDLKNGDFPKVFPFSEFSPRSVFGDLVMSPLNDPIVSKDQNGRNIDKQGRQVNSRGFLVDNAGNVVNQRGVQMFDKAILSDAGDIPKLFRMNLFQQSSGPTLQLPTGNNSSSEELKASTDRVIEMQASEAHQETSVDTMMHDTPANYNIPNQRFDYSPRHQEPRSHPLRPPQDFVRPLPIQTLPPSRNMNATMPPQTVRSTSRPAEQADYTNVPLQFERIIVPRESRAARQTQMEYLLPTEAEIMTAQAYGGKAKGQFRKPGVLYNEKRLKNKIMSPPNDLEGRADFERLVTDSLMQRKPSRAEMLEQYMTSPKEAGTTVARSANLPAGSFRKREAHSSNQPRRLAWLTQDAEDGLGNPLTPEEIEKWVDHSSLDLDSAEFESNVEKMAATQRVFKHDEKQDDRFQTAAKNTNATQITQRRPDPRDYSVDRANVPSLLLPRPGNNERPQQALRQSMPISSNLKRTEPQALRKSQHFERK